MRVAIPVVREGDDATHWFGVEVNDNGILEFYLDSEKLFSVDAGKIEELVKVLCFLHGITEVRGVES